MTAAQAGCEEFQYTYRWDQIGFPLNAEKRRLLNERDLELEEWLNRCSCKCGTRDTCPPFEYTHRWTVFPDDVTGVEVVRLLEDHDRELEQYLDSCFCECVNEGGGG